MSDQDGSLEQEGTAEPGTGDSQPEWFQADRFKSMEDQARSYDEAERRMQKALDERDQDRKELGQMREQMEEMLELMQQQPAQTMQQQPDLGSNPYVLQYANAMGVDLETAAAALGVQAQVTQELVQQMLQQQSPQQQGTSRLDDYSVEEMAQKMQEKYGADAEGRTKAMSIIEENPVLLQAYNGVIQSPDSTVGDLARIVETAYQLSGAETMRQEQQSLAQKQKEAEVARERKIASETLSSSGPTRVAPASEQKAIWDSIKNADDNRLIIGDR